MNFLIAALKVAGPRILGSIFAGTATWIAAKTQGSVTIDPEVAAATVTSILLSYAAAHRMTSSVVNPGDSAKGRVADAMKDASNVGGSVRVEKP